MSDIGIATLGAALMEADEKVREHGGNNQGDRIKLYLANVDPPINIAAPWCAAFVQYCADVAARGTAMPNVLDDVKQEALVQSYHDGLKFNIVPADKVLRGYLCLFKFSGSERWNHIGLVARPPSRVNPGVFYSVEGNTGDESQRDGDGVYLKQRRVGWHYPVEFIRW